jgi:uncharacterized protein (DUF1697 family)
MEVFLMKTTKAHIEKHINKHGTITVYSPENISLEIHKEPYITRADRGTVVFEMDCKDLADYCDKMGLYLAPSKNI